MGILITSQFIRTSDKRVVCWYQNGRSQKIEIIYIEVHNFKALLHSVGRDRLSYSQSLGNACHLNGHHKSESSFP